MIVIEGFDGAGKTTLIQRLQLDLPYHLILRTSGPPPDSESLYRALGVFEKVSTYSGLILTDRHPEISESIYGPTLRGSSFLVQPPQLNNTTGLVYCRPTINETFFRNLGKGHIDGVTEKTRDLIFAYDRFMETWLHHLYNYQEDSAYEQVLDYILRSSGRGDVPQVLPDQPD